MTATIEVILLLFNNKTDKGCLKAAVLFFFSRYKWFNTKIKMLECLYTVEKWSPHCRPPESPCCQKIWKFNWSWKRKSWKKLCALGQTGITGRLGLSLSDLMIPGHTTTSALCWACQGPWAVWWECSPILISEIFYFTEVWIKAGGLFWKLSRSLAKAELFYVIVYEFRAESMHYDYTARRGCGFLKWKRKKV